MKSIALIKHMRINPKDIENNSIADLKLLNQLMNLQHLKNKN